jgi:excisionase family DNA binding protein
MGDELKEQDSSDNPRQEHQQVSSDGRAPEPLPYRLAYNVEETAAVLGISAKSVRRLVSRRLLRPSRALRHILISRSEIQKFLERTS